VVRLLRLLRISWWRDAFYYELRYLLTRRRHAVRFGPRSPDFHYVPWKALRLLGRRAEWAGEQHVDWAWDDLTTTDPVPGAINGGCTDITKSAVDRAMLDAFGYGVAIDPRAARGMCVRKSEENTAHDGCMIECPSRREAGFVYQRLIDNRVGDEVLDLRLMKVGSGFPLGYLKYRPVDQRFLNTNSHVALFDPLDVFSEEELAMLLAATERLGLDVGEIDTVRDSNGRLYLLDLAKTPWGPPSGIRRADGRRAMRTLASELESYLTTTLNRPAHRATATASRG